MRPKLMQPSNLQTLKMRLSQLLEVLESQRTPVPPSLEQPLSLAFERLENVLQDIPREKDVAQNGVSGLHLSAVNSEHALAINRSSHELLSGTSDGHIVTSPDGVIQMANSCAAQLFEHSQQRLIGCSLSSLIVQKDRDALLKWLRSLHGDRQNWQGEFHLLSHSRDTPAITCTLTALRDTDGNLVGVHWLFRKAAAYQQAVPVQDIANELIHLLLSGMTLRQALSMFCRRLVETFGYPLVWIGTQEIQAAVNIVAHDGDPVLTTPQSFERLSFQASQSQAVSRAIDEQKAQILTREHSDDRHGVHWLCSEGLHCQLVIPLLEHDHLLGVLTICSQHADAFDLDRLSWMEQLGIHLSRVMFLAKNYDHLRLQGKALNHAEHAVCIANPEGKIEWVNDAYCRMSGYDAGELIGTVLPSSQSKPFRHLLNQASQPAFQSQSWKVESTAIRKDGQEYAVEEVLTPLVSEDGQLTNIVAILQDITRRKEAETQIIHRVYHDPLTDLPNRAMFQDRLEQGIAQARRHQRLLAVLFIDLDGFKGINDEFGHLIGDELLKTVAERLTHCVRATDTVARLSGDEFTLLLQDLEHPSDAQHVAQKILDCIGAPVSNGEQTLHVRTSIGIALFPVDAEEPADLLRQADRAMYKAKELGGQTWAFSSGDDRTWVPDPSS
ncbi:MAG: diguanylate cyclase [Nitrospirales bacterium]|nr:diguanylate cyclase [Nitrospira sp.]MDR4501756.1 diguanylate cyclase [Nitrospirales bacterium]